MFVCQDCGQKFDAPRKIKEKSDGLCSLPRIYYVCPVCKSENFKEREVKYCKCCGRAMNTNKKDYCSAECRKSGEKQYEAQRLKNIHIRNSPIYKTVRMLEEYNKEHKTNLSYGQFASALKV